MVNLFITLGALIGVVGVIYKIIKDRLDELERCNNRTIAKLNLIDQDLEQLLSLAASNFRYICKLQHMKTITSAPDKENKDFSAFVQQAQKELDEIKFLFQRRHK